MRVAGLICARSGSKGVPRKNLQLLAGTPLITRAVGQALALGLLDHLLVSTDSEEIAAVARAAGAEVPFLRPASLARDDSPEWLVWRHALEYLGGSDAGMPDALLVIPTTAPLRSVDDLKACLTEFDRGDVDVVITVTAARRNPYFNMVTVLPDGTARPVIDGGGSPRRRQEAPPVYDMTTVAYVARPEFVMTQGSLFEGRVRAVEIPAERALDIDTPLDLRIAEYLAAAP